MRKYFFPLKSSYLIFFFFLNLIFPSKFFYIIYIFKLEIVSAISRRPSLNECMSLARSLDVDIVFMPVPCVTEPFERPSSTDLHRLELSEHLGNLSNFINVTSLPSFSHLSSCFNSQ